MAQNNRIGRGSSGTIFVAVYENIIKLLFCDWFVTGLRLAGGIIISPRQNNRAEIVMTKSPESQIRETGA